MKIGKATLVDVINKLKPAIPKTTLGVPRGILLKDHGLFAFNLEIGIKANLELETDESFIIPYEALELILKLPDGVIEIKSKKDHRIVIKCMGIQTEYASLPPEQFPALPEVSPNVSVSMMNCEEFSKQVKATLYAVDDTAQHEFIRGLLFKVENDKLDVIGTDSYRISWYQTECKDELNFRIPKMAVEQVMKIIDGEEEVGVLHDEKIAIFSVKEYQVFTRLLVNETKGVDVRSFFNQKTDPVLVNRRELIESIDRVITIISTNASDKRSMVIDVENTSLKLSAKSDTSDYEETIQLVEPTDLKLKIGINPKYMKDALKSYSVENLALGFTGPVTPILINVEEENLRSLLLPVKI